MSLSRQEPEKAIRRYKAQRTCRAFGSEIPRLSCEGLIQVSSVATNVYDVGTTGLKRHSGG
jgi:hypothetical protein